MLYEARAVELQPERMRMKEHLFDKRVVQRALQEGLLDKEVYQRMLDELPDLSHKVQVGGAVEEPVASSGLQNAAPLADDDYDDEDDDDVEAPMPDQQAMPASTPHTASDTIEMERPQIPGNYSPDY
jgi:hypothetical protein